MSHFSCTLDFYLATCCFEKDLCGWIQGAAEELDWERWSGPNESPNAGPPGDHTSGNGEPKTICTISLSAQSSHVLIMCLLLYSRVLFVHQELKSQQNRGYGSSEVSSVSPNWTWWVLFHILVSHVWSNSGITKNVCMWHFIWPHQTHIFMCFSNFTCKTCFFYIIKCKCFILI